MDDKEIKRLDRKAKIWAHIIVVILIVILFKLIQYI